MSEDEKISWSGKRIELPDDRSVWVGTSEDQRTEGRLGVVFMNKGERTAFSLSQEACEALVSLLKPHGIIPYDEQIEAIFMTFDSNTGTWEKANP